VGGWHPVSISAGTPRNPDRGFPQTLQANPATGHKIRPRPLPVVPFIFITRLRKEALVTQSLYSTSLLMYALITGLCQDKGAR
jgi:hypothetical protein